MELCGTTRGTAIQSDYRQLKSFPVEPKCSGTVQPYVMVSRCTSIEVLLILRDLDFGVIIIRHSQDSRNEFTRSELLNKVENVGEIWFTKRGSES